MPRGFGAHLVVEDLFERTSICGTFSPRSARKEHYVVVRDPPNPPQNSLKGVPCLRAGYTFSVTIHLSPPPGFRHGVGPYSLAVKPGTRGAVTVLALSDGR